MNLWDGLSRGASVWLENDQVEKPKQSDHIKFGIEFEGGSFNYAITLATIEI